MNMSDGYDPQKSRIAEDRLADFLRAPLTGDLLEVPGIGSAAISKLARVRRKIAFVIRIN